MKKIPLYYALALLVAVSLLSLIYYRGDYRPKNLVITDAVKVTSITDNQGKLIDIGMPCSLTQIDKDHLIFVNYANMFLLDMQSGKAVLLPKPQGVDVWCPTGVKWCPESKLLYLANYKGNDILILKITDDNHLVLVKRYTDPNLVGPENIDVIDGGKVFAVADFDADKVLLFNEMGLLWSHKVGNAHGIAFNGDHKTILASGLSPARVYEFNLQGELIREIGKEGWGENEYLWPTSITILDKKIAVTDAHTGKISFLDNSLKTKKTIGGNGLGLDLFNMPYGIEFTNAEFLYVTDTFKGRILKINPHTAEIISIYQGVESFGINQEIVTELQAYCHTPPNSFLAINNESTLVKEEPLGLTYKERINTSQWVTFGLNKNLLSTKWRLSYNKFVSGKKVVFLTGSSPLFSSGPYYWIIAKNYKYKNKDLIIIGSPQVKEWLVVYKDVVCPIAVGLDFWIKNDMLVSSQGKSVPFDSLCKAALTRIKAYSLSIKRGENPLDAMAECIFGANDFKARFALAFESEKGKLFRDALLKSNCIQEYHRAAREYLESIKDDQYFYFCEIMIANMLLKKVFLDADHEKNPVKPFNLAIPTKIENITHALIEQNKPKSDFEKLILLSQYNNNFSIGIPESKKNQNYFMTLIESKVGQCGDFANLLAAQLATQNILCHIIALHNYPPNDGHVVLEAFVDGRWILFDPTYSSYFVHTDPSGQEKILNFNDLRFGAYNKENIKKIILNKARYRAGRELAEGFTSLDIYEKAEPAGIISRETIFWFPLTLDINKKPKIETSDPKNYAKNQGSHFLGSDYVNSCFKLLLSGLSPKKKYQVRVHFSGASGKIVKENVEFKAHAFQTSLDTLPITAYHYSLNNKGEKEWNIDFIAKGKDDIIFITHDNTSTQIYMNVDKITLQEIS